MSDVSQWCVELPAKTIVESQVGTNLPAILSKQVHRRRADILLLSRTLLIGIRQAQEIVGIQIVESDVVGSAAEIVVVPTNFEEEGLIETHPAQVSAKLHGVIAFDFCQTIRPLK